MQARKRIQWQGYLCLTPLAIMVCIFLLYPLLNGVYTSFFTTKYGFGDMAFAGFRNYINIFKEEKFPFAIRNSIIWVLASILLNSVIPIGIALLLNREFRGKPFVIGALLIPWMTPVVGFGMMNKWFLEPDVGVLNRVLQDIGILSQGINFLGRTDLALPVLILLNFWQTSSFGILMISSALSTIPEEQYDAMKVDGANFMQTLKNLVMPSIGFMVGFMLFLGTVQTFNNYALIFLLTKGGPSNATYTIPVMIYEKAFNEFNIGQSTALASIVGIILIALGIRFFRGMSKEQT